MWADPDEIITLRFMSAHQMYMYAMAIKLEKNDMAKEILACKNPWELRNKNFNLQPTKEWLKCRIDKMKEALLLKWLWCAHFRQALNTEKREANENCLCTISQTNGRPHHRKGTTNPTILDLPRV